MEPSPYNPGSSPAYLAGRGRELELVREQLSRLSALQRSGGPLLGFHAPRGVGKTSLLRRAQRDAIDAGFITAWVTGRPDVPMLASLANDVSREVQDSVDSGPSKALLQRLDQVQVEFGVPGLKVGAQVDTHSSGTDQLRSDALEGVLEDAARFAQNHDKIGLVLFVDEFQDAQLADRKSLLIALQHFDGDPRGCPVAIVAAGLPSLPAAVTEAATFGERSRFQHVGLLSDVAVAEALKIPADQLGVRWTTDAIEHAIDYAQGYGHTVQLIGDATWRYARPEQGTVLEVGHVRGGEEEADRQLDQMMQTRLDRATPEQRRVISAMAALEKPGTGVQRAVLADRLGVDSQALSRPRQELIDRGIVEPAGRGQLRFTIPGFAEFVRGTDLAENAEETTSPPSARDTFRRERDRLREATKRQQDAGAPSDRPTRRDDDPGKPRPRPKGPSM